MDVYWWQQVNSVVTEALVSELREDGMVLTLVSLSAGQCRDVVVGAGCFAEHRFDRVQGDNEAEDVNAGYFRVCLRLGTQIELDIGMERYCNKRTYPFSWYEEEIRLR